LVPVLQHLLRQFCNTFWCLFCNINGPCVAHPWASFCMLPNTPVPALQHPGANFATSWRLPCNALGDTLAPALQHRKFCITLVPALKQTPGHQLFKPFPPRCQNGPTEIMMPKDAEILI
jgi:hypothetical protein